MGDDEEICEGWASKYPNVKYHYLSPDPGIYAVWNMVCRAAVTPYITNANVDDRLYPKCLEKHVALLDEKPEIDLAYCKNRCTVIRNDDIDAKIRRGSYPTYKFDPKRMLRGNLPHNHPVWRKSLHDKFGYFDDTIYSAADWEFWLRCVAGGSQFELIPEFLGLYYWNPDGISTSNMGELNRKKLTAEALVRREYQGKINELLREST
jgi:hypothetical protein